MLTCLWYASSQALQRLCLGRSPEFQCATRVPQNHGQIIFFQLTNLPSTRHSHALPSNKPLKDLKGNTKVLTCCQNHICPGGFFVQT